VPMMAHVMQSSDSESRTEKPSFLHTNLYSACSLSFVKAHCECFYCLWGAIAGCTVGVGLSVREMSREEEQENLLGDLSAGGHEENGELHWESWTFSDLV